MASRKLAALVAQINKEHGDGTLVTGSQLRTQKIERVPTGSLALDLALGGGWPLNQWHELIGDESSGKTVVALKTVAANQERDPKYMTLWIAAESLPPEWAAVCGVDLDRLIVADHTVMEEAYETALTFLASREIDCVIIDSLPALVPMVEDVKDMDEDTVALGAKLTAKFLRKANKAMRRSLIAADRPILPIMINQWRQQIGVRYGDPRTTPGGKAKNYFYFTRVEMKRDDWLTVGPDKTKVGQRIHALVVKNKSAPGRRDAYFDFYFDKGGAAEPGTYDVLAELEGIARAKDIIVFKKRKWMVEDDTICEKKSDILTSLRAEPALAARVDKLVRGVPTKKRSLVAPKKKAS